MVLQGRIILHPLSGVGHFRKVVDRSLGSHMLDAKMTR